MSSERQPSSADLVAAGLREGLVAVGVCRAEVQQPARSILHLRRRAGLSGEMQFTYRNPDRSTDPDTALPGARSWVVAAHRYPGDGPGGPPVEQGGTVTGRVAQYAQANHYEDLRRRLEPLAVMLRQCGHRAVVVADSNQLVDRHAAWRAGIGWYGKNSNILVPGIGSWVVLGAIVTDAELDQTGTPLPDGCGRCSRCIENCPTGAIIAPGIVDATACLAWLVQGPGDIPLHHREAVGDRIYGCDDCQTVCPPNLTSALPDDRVEPPSDSPTDQDLDMLELLTWDDHTIVERCGQWYIAERDMDHVRRTALVIVGNTARPEPIQSARRVVETLDCYLDHANPILQRHAVWAARRLGLDDLLTDRFSTDREPRRPSGAPERGAGRRDDDPLHAELTAAVSPRFRPEVWAPALTEGAKR